MAWQRVKITVKTRTRRIGKNSGYEKCRMCNGTGRQKSPKK